MFDTRRLYHCGMSFLATLAILSVAVEFAVGQTASQRRRPDAMIGAADLVALATQCGGEQPAEESLELVRKHGCRNGRTSTGEVLAFEENRWFVYALADMTRESSEASPAAPQAIRRLLLIKPSTLVIEDVILAEASGRLGILSRTEVKVDGKTFQVSAEGTAIDGERVLPEDATPSTASRPAQGDRPAIFYLGVSAEAEGELARFVHVFQVGGGDSEERPEIVEQQDGLQLSVPAGDKVVQLTLPSKATAAGYIQIAAADGAVAVPQRLLPSSVMPHGPEGAQLMERWDAPYRRDQMPGWDVGRPCTHLVKAVEEGTFKPGRAIVFGCGSGTNAIYLAKKGFDVIGVDVSPTALVIAAKKASEAGVEVEWMLADVVTLPKLPAVDLIFDRGCYHHICQYDSPGYVASLCRLSKAGTQAMILAGSPADGGRGGPPRIPEETIRNDFSKQFDFEWLRAINFDSRREGATGTSAWSIHLRRKSE